MEQRLYRVARELKTSKSYLDNQDFVTKAIILDMLEAEAASALPPSVRPKVVSLLGVFLKLNPTYFVQ